MAGEVKLVLCGVLCCLLSIGLYHHVNNINNNKCDMTYMFQRPHYIEIDLPPEVKDNFPQYGVYAYGEGEYSIHLYKGQFNGIPVLFIPGNGGSHKQVRSLASVAYRKSLEDDGPDFHFNFFTVDINGELGALYGPVLQRQTAFVTIAIRRILQLYDEGGNSDGGVGGGGNSGNDGNDDGNSGNGNSGDGDGNSGDGSNSNGNSGNGDGNSGNGGNGNGNSGSESNGNGNSGSESNGNGNSGNDGSGNGNSGNKSNRNGNSVNGTRPIVKPDSVILIGHSMGGMVGRAVYTHRDNNGTITPTMVPLIITQATPHTRPVIVLDQQLNDFYDKVNAYWIMERDYDLKDVVLVTVGGGRNDIQVPTTRANTPVADISTTTADVPYCWLTADHQAIVWCRQLVLATVRALFDVIDTNTNKLSTNRTRILDVFNYHLVKRVSAKRYDNRHYPNTVDVEKDSRWVEVTRRQHTHAHTHTSKRTYLHVALQPGNSLYQHITIVAIGLETKNWVLTCVAKQDDSNNNNNINNNNNKSSRLCKSAVNLSQHTKKLPGKFKMLEVDMEALETDGYTHVLVNIPPTDDMVEVWIDIHSEGGRSRTINLPAFIRSFTPMLVEDSTPLHAATYNVTLRGLTELWQSYQVTVKPRNKCVVPPSVSTSAILNVPWATQPQSYLYNSGHTGITYMVELDVPPYTSNTTPTIKFILNPQCTYTIIIQSSLVGVFRRVVLLYGTQVPTYITVHLLLTLAKQLKTMGESGECPSFFTSIVTLTPLAVVPFVKITNLILRNVDIMDDFTLLGTIGEELPLLPIILFLGTLPFTLLLGATIWVVIVLSGHTLHTILIRILGRNMVGIGNTGMTSEITLATLHTLPALVSVTLLSVCYVTCGSLTLTLAVIYYFVKISRLYENYLEKMLLGLITTTTTTTTTTTGNTDNRGGNSDNRGGNTDNSSGENRRIGNTGNTNNGGSGNNDDGGSGNTADANGGSGNTANVGSGNIGGALSHLHFHVTLLMLCVVLVTLGLPTMVIWTRLARNKLTLTDDPTLITSMLALITLTILWQKNIPYINRRWYRELSWCVQALATLTLLFGCVNVFRVCWCVAATLVLVAAHQVLAPRAHTHTRAPHTDVYLDTRAHARTETVAPSNAHTHTGV